MIKYILIIIFVFSCNVAWGTPNPSLVPVPKELHLSKWGTYVHINELDKETIDRQKEEIKTLKYRIIYLEDKLRRIHAIALKIMQDLEK